ncbi:MAG: TonB-dependent receptor, partial [Gemmatimonadota bacterium]
MRMRIRAFFLLMIGMAVGAVSLAAQTGTISGRVTIRETGATIGDAVVTVTGGSGQRVGGTVAGASGTYRLTGLSAGTYSVLVTAVGFTAVRVDNVAVTAGGTATADAALVAKPFELDPVVITGSRAPEKALESPASVHVVPTVDITERPALTVIDHLKALPGVDISQGGLVQSNVVGRGFNNIFSGAMLVISDNRFAAVPSLRVNVAAFAPTTNDDVERVEFVLGPGAALYGPNAANGVLNIITKSPISSPGTRITLESGFRSDSRDSLGTSFDGGNSVLRMGFRHASRLSDKFGFKVSAEILKSEEWRAKDPAEPASLPGKTCPAGFGCRDFDLERVAADFRADYRPTAGSEIIASAGRTNAGNLIEYTGIGAAQARDWSYTYYQVRARYNRLFFQVFRNQSNSGNDSPQDNSGSFLLRDGKPIVDRSNVNAAQLQHGFKLGARQDFIYGVDYSKTNSVTDGTINGRNEEDDDITEVGGYLQSRTELTSKLNLVAALRVDDHSRVADPVFSPRAALVFTPAENHNFRVTYNRAFSTPSSNNLFLDIVAGQAGPYKVRALGVPRGGFSFRGYCGTGGVDDLCMWPGPFPGAPQTALPAQARTLWAVAAGAVAPALGPLAPLLLGVPVPTTVGTQLRRLDATAGVFRNVAPTEVADISVIQPTITNAYELGYKGIINDKFRISIDGWFQRKENFVGPLIVESPSVFLDLATTTAHLMTYLYPGLRQVGLSDAAAQATVQQVAVGMAGLNGGSVAAGLSGVPLATIVPNDPL